MSKEWIIDVLGDLRGFAIANAMPTLAEQLDEAITVAAVEIGQIGPGGYIEANGTEAGRPAGTTF